MVIHGFQKLTLLDYPGKVACTLFSGGCNFRCPFCQNGNLVQHPEWEPVIPEVEQKKKSCCDSEELLHGEEAKKTAGNNQWTNNNLNTGLSPSAHWAMPTRW